MVQVEKQDRIIDASFGLKILNGIYMEFMLMRMKRRKKGRFLYIGSRAILITTIANLLDTKCEFYGFNDKLMDTIN